MWVTRLLYRLRSFAPSSLPPLVNSVPFLSDLEAVMAYSKNWAELKHTWEQWRDKTGKLMRDDFVRFVELSNKAATLDGQSLVHKASVS